jgi:hypothetical protein
MEGALNPLFIRSLHDILGCLQEVREAHDWIRKSGQADLSLNSRPNSQFACRISRVAHSSHIPAFKEPLG